MTFSRTPPSGFMSVVVLAAFTLGALSRPPDYTVLSRRISSSKSGEASVRCLLLDNMLPRQRVQLQFGPPVSTALSEGRQAGEAFVVVGLDRRKGTICRRGVEVRIESMSPYRASHGFFSSHSTTPMRGFTVLDTVLVGGRCCEILEPDISSSTWRPSKPIFEARVRWLPDGPSTSAANALAESVAPMVSEWVDLVRSTNREREPLQITRVLSDLGPMPDAEQAGDRALWVAALINPMPALGVALEVRAAVLDAADSLARMQVVHEALADSISRLKSMPPGPFEVEPPPGVRR